jgi:enoyl-CoA hydratase/carnithine racemase
MSDLTQIRYERDGAIGTLTLDREEVLNALSPTLISELYRTLQEIAESDLRVLIVTGAGERAFSAGVDLKAASSAEYTREVHRRFSDEARKAITLLETMPQVTIARVRGFCFTGGLEVAMGCDFILAGDDALFADTHARLGLTSGWGLSQRLSRRIGVQRAKAMSYTGKRIGPAEAERVGLILEHVPSDKLEARVAALAEQLAAVNIDSIRDYKLLYRASQNIGLDDGLLEEAARKRAPRRQPITEPLSNFLKK